MFKQAEILTKPVASLSKRFNLPERSSVRQALRYIPFILPVCPGGEYLWYENFITDRTVPPYPGSDQRTATNTSS